MPGQDPLDTAKAPGFAAPQGTDAVRLQQLARVSNELGAADTMEDVIEAAVRHAARAIGASVSTLMITEGDRLRLLAGEGLRDGVFERWSSFGIDDRNPASEAVRTGRPVMLGSPPVIESTYPVLRDEMPAGRSLVCLPLDSSQPSVGVVGLTFEAGWLPGTNEIDFLTAYADACGQAIRRVQAAAVAQARAKRLTFLARVSQELNSSLDDRATSTNVANLIVPELADWCAVSVVQDGTVNTLAVAHHDADLARELQQLQDTFPDGPIDAARVIRTGVSELHLGLSAEVPASGDCGSEQRSGDPGSALVVPLTARGRTLGAITMVRTGDKPAYDDSDRAFAEDLAQRAGVAVENAQLYAQTQDVALQLQRAVLPEALHDIAGWEIATYYAPGGRGGVGGDFYDAIPLPDGRLAFVIGDVMGHGVPAAAAMAQLRSAVRAYLCIDPEPAAVVRKLDVMFAELAITQLATLVYGVVDADAGSLSFVNAGHYPPALVCAGQAPVYVHTPPRLPLGAGGDERTTTTIDFGARDALLLFTDGLVEHRGEVVDAGLNRLAALAPALHDGALQDQLDILVAALSRDAHGDDDTTAFALRGADPR